MLSGLKRFQREGDDHFITFSCYRRKIDATPRSRYILKKVVLEFGLKQNGYRLPIEGCRLEL
jgi:hypothetical protein